MFRWFQSRVTAAYAATRDFFSGLATGLFVLWLFPRMAEGVGAIMVIGLLTCLFH